MIFASELEFNKQRLEKSKAAFDEQIELERNSLKGLSNIYGEYYQILRELENQQYKNDILNAQGNADKILAIEKKHSKSILDIEIAEFNAKKDLQLQYVGIVGSVGGLLKQIAGKNKALAITALLLEKAAAIATIVVQTAKSLGAATLAAAPMLANPFTAIPAAILLAKSLAMAKVSAGISIAGIVLGAAQGIAAINQAAPGGDSVASSGGGSSLPDLGGASPMGSGGAIPTINQMDTPDLGGGGGGGGVDRASGDTIVRAYVVETDITNTQSRMQEIENRARFE